MLASLRTYRLVAASLAVLLLLSGCLPLVQHACAMAARPASAPDARPCPHDAPAPAHHHGDAPMMHAPTHAALPCPDETTPQAEPGTCCTVEAAQAVAASGILQLKRALKPVLAPVAAVGAEAPSQAAVPLSFARCFDGGPSPAASVSLHLLHGVFLN